MKSVFLASLSRLHGRQARVFEGIAKKTASQASLQTGASEISLGTDLARDPVYLSGVVIPSVEFAEAMLVLGRVAKIRKPEPKDNSIYQAWVQQEYRKAVEIRLQDNLPERRELNSELENLRAQRDALSANLRKIISGFFFYQKFKAYNRWARYNDREAWLPLDPIVSVQSDGTFFEAFSQDETTYARVYLPHKALSMVEDHELGTTNIDFSDHMEKEFERVRSYRAMKLRVGLNSVEFSTKAASVTEEKIELPETWVRGLVEVQSVLSLSPVEFDVSSDLLAEVIARLQSERERTGPRSLKFILNPGQPIQVEIEPWAEVISDNSFDFSGDNPGEVRVWGRRRLFALESILVNAEKVRVRLLGSGMPSFWTIVNEGIETTVGLSGWSSTDWTSKAKFSSFLPSADIDPLQLEIGLRFLEEEGSLDIPGMATSLGTTPQKAAAVLQKLCMQGKAMYDPERSIYRWRDLFPTFAVFGEGESSNEEVAGLSLVNERAITKIRDDVNSGMRSLEAAVDDNSRIYNSKIELDLDFRPRSASCTCPYFKYNKLKQGPCRHMIALSIYAVSN